MTKILRSFLSAIDWFLDSYFPSDLEVRGAVAWGRVWRLLDSWSNPLFITCKSHRIMFSRLIYIIECVKISFVFMTEQYSIVCIDHICLSIYLLMDTWPSIPSPFTLLAQQETGGQTVPCPDRKGAREAEWLSRALVCKAGEQDN